MFRQCCTKRLPLATIEVNVKRSVRKTPSSFILTSKGYQCSSFFFRYFGAFLEYGRPVRHHIICEELDEDGNGRMFAVLVVIEDVRRFLNVYKETYIPLIIEKYKSLISDNGDEGNEVSV